MNLQIKYLRNMYLSGALTPSDLVKQLDAEIGSDNSRHIWIRRLTLDEMLTFAKNLEGKTAVSYTHLDVYKRQVLYRQERYVW